MSQERSGAGVQVVNTWVQEGTDENKGESDQARLRRLVFWFMSGERGKEKADRLDSC